MQNEIYLSIIIPAYNEEKRLAKTLEKVDEYLRKQSFFYEIIVISDGSKDKTAQVVKDLIPRIQNLQLIDNKENHGKGYVVRQGMMEAQGKFRIFTDADNSTSIDQIEKILPEFEKGFEVVIGSRDIKGAVIATPQSLIRRKLGDIFNLIVQVVSGLWGIWDTQCGFKGFSKKAVEEIFPKCKINRWAFDVEILVLAKKFKYQIKEIPVTWVNDPNSKVSLKGMIRMLFEVFQVRINTIAKKYDQKGYPAY